VLLVAADEPADRVDAEQLRAPAHWDVGFIRRFMLFFGPLSSLFDFLTFAILLGVFHAGPELFRTGWFIESMATQVLVIFVIRTRRSPFWKSGPGPSLLVASLAVVLLAVLIPFSPASGLLGFVQPPPVLLLVMAVMALAYLTLVDFAKRVFYAEVERVAAERRRGWREQVHRRAARFSHGGRLPSGAQTTSRDVVPR
jgi:Mg2+-importing ATPase